MGHTFGKFTKSKKFKLHITCLDAIAPYAQYKVRAWAAAAAADRRRRARRAEAATAAQVWLKPSAEQSFLYGNNVLKAGLGRITEDTPQYQGVIVLSMSDVPLGFGVAAKSTAECRQLDPQAIVAFHQADIGEYLRDEDALS